MNLPSGSQLSIIFAALIIGSAVLGTRFVDSFQIASGIGDDGSPILWLLNSRTGELRICGANLKCVSRPAVAQLSITDDQENPFARFGRPTGPPGVDPFVGRADSPLLGQDEGASSSLGAITRGAVRGVAPAAGGLAGAGVGAAIGAFLGGAALPPVGEIPGALLGRWIGGALLGFGATYSSEAAREYALSQLPSSTVFALGQDEPQKRLDEHQHGSAALIGSLLPYVLAALILVAIFHAQGNPRPRRKESSLSNAVPTEPSKP